MKICLLTRALPCHQDGGLEYHTVTLAQELGNLGHSVTVLTTGHGSEPCSRKFPFEVIHAAESVPATYNLGFFKFVHQHLQGNKYDIVHSQGFAGFGALLEKEIQLVTTVHGTLTSETPLFYEPSWQNLWRHRKRLAIKPLYQQLLKKSKLIFVDSQFSHSLVLNDAPESFSKLAVVPLGIDTRRFQPMDIEDCRKKIDLQDLFTLICVGRVTESKGFQVVVKALESLKELPVQLVIAGNGPYWQSLKEISHSMNLQNVLYLTKINDQQLPSLYNSANLFIHPDLTAPAFGLVAVEAMACGIPVLASDSGALPEIIASDCGFMFPRGDAEQLAWLIKYLYEERNIRNGMGAKARFRAVTLYDSVRMAKEVESCYQSILG